MEYICENSKHLERIVDDSVIVYNEVMNVMDILPTNVANAIPTNMTNTMSTNV